MVTGDKTWKVQQKKVITGISKLQATATWWIQFKMFSTEGYDE